MKFWKTTILFHLFNNKPPNVYMRHTDDSYTAKDVMELERSVFSYMGKNGIDKISTTEISKEEWLAYWKKCGYDKPYGIE